MSASFQSPLPTFTGLDGLPLSAGYVYVGTANQDPEQYPITVYWDEAMSQVADQPLRTMAGYISRNGAPATVWVAASCSIRVRDSQNRQVYYVSQWSTPALGVADATAEAIVDVATARDNAIADVTTTRDELEDSIEELSARLTEQAEDVANGVGTSARPVYASTSAGLAVTTEAQKFYVPHSTIDNMLVQYENLAGVATDTGRRFNQTTGEELGTAISLLDTELEGLAIDATCDDSTQRVKVIDSVTPANDYEGDLLGFLAATCFPNAKIVTLEDGTLGWSDHNFFSDSEGFNSGNWIRTTLTASPPSAGLCTLTATSTTGVLRAPVQVVEPGRYYTITFIGKQGTAPYAYVRIQATTDVYAYFDLSTGTVGTVDAGGTANIYTTYEDGSALPTGEYRMVVSRQVPAGVAAINGHYGLADADASTNVTNGRTGYLRRAASSFGKKPTQYIRTTAGVKYSPTYDWSKGARRVLIEEWTTRFESQHSDDMTQPDWAKTNVTPALDATGPHGEPCSSLTATANDGTCLQALTATHATNTFQAYVKRRTGTGSVYMTINGGTDWTDITSDIDSAGYSRVYVKGSSTTVNMGFKLATSGDAIEVALAVNGSKAGVAVIMAPVTTYGAALYQHASDLFRVPFTRFNATAPFTAYFDFDTSDDSNAVGEAAGVLGAADYHFILRSTDGVLRQSNISSTLYTNSLADRTTRVEGAMRVKANDVAATVNGGGECYDNRPGVGTLTDVSIGATTGQIFLRRFLVVPRALVDDSSANWRYSGDGADQRYLADIKVAKFQEVADTHICREPGVEVIQDDHDHALLSVAFFQRYITPNPGSGEAPGRIVRSTFRFDKTTHTLTNLTGQVVVAQQASWDSGLGHQQGVVQIKLRYGSKRGRCLLLYSQLDSASGELEVPPDHRRIYCMSSDDNMTTFSSATMVYDPGSGSFALGTGSGSAVQIIIGANAGRIVVPIYKDFGCGALYSDDGGDTWTAGTLTNAGAEPTIHLLPDGTTLVMTMRQEASPWRTYATSTDGGATWSASANMTLTEGVNVAMALLQNDPEGEHGRYGEQLLIGVRRTAPTYLIRSKLTIEEVTGPTLAVSGEQFCPIGQYRGSGYASARAMSGGYIAIAYESAPTGLLNGISDIRLMVVSWP